MECLSMTADRLKENPKSPLLDLCSVTDLEAGGSAGANGGNTNSTSSKVFSRIRSIGPEVESAPSVRVAIDSVIEGVREA